jgi:hypothetical protein
VKRTAHLTLLLAGAAVGCAYYNGMWNAERLAHEARRQEATGLEAEARLTWARAAVQAESVLVHHPHSRWADDALVLQAEGLARSGACAAAVNPLRRVLTTVSDDALRERASLAAADCLVRHDRAGDVDRLLAPVLESRDPGRRSSAAYLAGQAALARGNGIAAARLFAQSARPDAGPARLRALIQAGRWERAIALVDSVARRTGDESVWADVLEALERAAGPEPAADALDSLLRYGRLVPGAQARLLIADGDRLRAARLFDRATARYTAAQALVPDSVEGGRARLRLVLTEAAEVADPDSLDSLATRLEILAGALTGPAQMETRTWQQQINAIRRADSGEVTAFRAAELARDTLEAPGLAAQLFLRFASRYPSSLFAPKALIAAGQLHGIAADSVDRMLRARYAESPYTLAYQGAASPAFQAVEESLAIAFGVARPSQFPVAAAGRVAAPRPGPRGPRLEPTGVGRPPRARNPRPAPPAETRPDRPRRPGERPQARPPAPGERPKGDP